MAENLKNLLKEIEKSNELTFFFKDLWSEHSSLSRLFFLHREQLFPVGNKIVLPYLFWSTAKEEDEGKTGVLYIFEELEEIKRKKALNTLEFKDFIHDMKDFFAYYVLKVMRVNEDLKSLILDDNFSFRKMKRKLRDYESINLDVLEESEIESIPELSSIVKTNVENFMKQFDIISMFKVISSIYGIVTTLPLQGISHLEKFYQMAALDPDEYQDLIRELYMLKLITNFQTLFWCESCLDDPQIFLTKSRIDPDRLKLKCLKCKKEMLVSSIYHIDELLRECIMLKDGIIAVALGWLFNNKSVKWEFSTHNKYENDFICSIDDKKIMFECKMHLIPKDQRSLEGQLTQDLNLLVKHAQELSEKDVHLARIYLVYNYELEMFDPKDVKRVLNNPKLKKNLTKFQIELISYLEIPRVLKSEGLTEPETA